jgi:exodeoxyribonuclease-3
MFKLTTWNVNGIRAREADVLEWIRREAPDVLCLQEVKASIEQVPASLVELPGYWCYWHGHAGYSGVGLHLAKRAFPVAPSFAHPDFDHETRIVTARVGSALFASLYVPNGGKDFPAKERFLDALDEWVRVRLQSGVALVLAGDLNVAREPRDVHAKLRDDRHTGQTPGEREKLERLIGRGLVDLSRKFHPTDDELFTWWAPWRNHRERNIGWRLDYVLAHRIFADAAVSCAASREFGSSDHGPVTASFDCEPPRAGDRDPASAVVVPSPGQLRLF